MRFKYPNVLFTIAPSGIKLPIFVAKMLKAMGYLAGTPDMLIFERRRGFPALFLEIKTEVGKVSLVQKEFLSKLTDRGYLVHVCFGFNAAIHVIDHYFEE